MSETEGTVALGEVVNFIRKATAPEKIPESSQYILLEHVIGRTGQVLVARAGAAEIKSSKFAFEPGDVLFGKLRPGLRKCCVASEAGYCSTDIVPLRPMEDHSSFYLAAVLRSDHFASQVERLIGGANLPRVNVKELLGLTIRWPDTEERKRLDQLAQMAIEVRQETLRMLSNVDDLEASISRA